MPGMSSRPIQRSRPARFGLQGGGSERRGAAADGLQADRQPLAAARAAADVGDERVPLRVAVEVGEHLPDSQ